jgi:hypothetical protein
MTIPRPVILISFGVFGCPAWTGLQISFGSVLLVFCTFIACSSRLNISAAGQLFFTYFDCGTPADRLWKPIRWLCHCLERD